MASDGDTTLSITRFAGVVLSTIKFSPDDPDQPLNQVIECLRLARKHKPDLLEASRPCLVSYLSLFHNFCE